MSAVRFEDSDRNTPGNSSLFVVVRPAYPLIPELERDDWPVSISLDAIPFCVTRGTYNVLTVVLSSALAFSLFLTAWVFSNMVSLMIMTSILLVYQAYYNVCICTVYIVRSKIRDFFFVLNISFLVHI